MFCLSFSFSFVFGVRLAPPFFVPAVVVGGDCCSCRRRAAVTVAFALAAAVTVAVGEAAVEVVVGVHQARFTCCYLLQAPRFTPCLRSKYK